MARHGRGPLDARALHGDRRPGAVGRLRHFHRGDVDPRHLPPAMRMIPILAHAGHQHLDLSWSWEPVTIALLALTFALYTLGAFRTKLPRWQMLAFYAGWLSLVIALGSPLDGLGGILFSAHMAQHEVLMVVAAPLLVLGRPLAAFLWAMPRRARLPMSAW